MSTMPHAHIVKALETDANARIRRAAGIPRTRNMLTDAEGWLTSAMYRRGKGIPNQVQLGHYFQNVAGIISVVGTWTGSAFEDALDRPHKIS